MTLDRDSPCSYREGFGRTSGLGKLEINRSERALTKIGEPGLLKAMTAPKHIVVLLLEARTALDVELLTCHTELLPNG